MAKRGRDHIETDFARTEKRMEDRPTPSASVKAPPAMTASLSHLPHHASELARHRTESERTQRSGLEIILYGGSFPHIQDAVLQNLTRIEAGTLRLVNRELSTSASLLEFAHPGRRAARVWNGIACQESVFDPSIVPVGNMCQAGPAEGVEVRSCALHGASDVGAAMVCREHGLTNVQAKVEDWQLSGQAQQLTSKGIWTCVECVHVVSQAWDNHKLKVEQSGGRKGGRKRGAGKQRTEKQDEKWEDGMGIRTCICEAKWRSLRGRFVCWSCVVKECSRVSAWAGSLRNAMEEWKACARCGVQESIEEELSSEWGGARRISWTSDGVGRIAWEEQKEVLWCTACQGVKSVATAFQGTWKGN